jgi:adenylylsulfate kinase-like enzyme
MIIVLFGQPHSGKTTLAKELSDNSVFHNIDGDVLRDVFKYKDYSREGRIKNLNRASDIAVYLDLSKESDVVLSLVYPYKEARDYLNSLSDNVKWVYLHYEGERGREKFHVDDFELYSEENILSLDTSKYSIYECINKINHYINE